MRFYSEDFAKTLNRVSSQGFVNLDPPYDPVSSTARFTAYSKEGFGRSEQLRLKECCDRLTARNVKFLLSNSATDFILELYHGYNIKIVQARRTINAAAGKRGPAAEVLISNYDF